MGIDPDNRCYMVERDDDDPTPTIEELERKLNEALYKVEDLEGELDAARGGIVPSDPAADARIDACLRACASIPTDQLNRPDFIAAVAKLKRDRDALLSAAIVADEHLSYENAARSWPAREYVRKAIEQAKSKE
jgi:hypothetical protein